MNQNGFHAAVDVAPSDEDHSSSAYRNMRERLKVNFRVAVWTNLLAVGVLLASVVGAVVLSLMGETVPTILVGGLGVADIAWGWAEKPWRQLLVANNRIALTESVWIAYIENRRAIENNDISDAQRSMLRQAQNLWITRTAVIGQDDFGKAAGEIRAVNEASERVTLELLRQLPAAAAGRTQLAAPTERGKTLSELMEEAKLQHAKPGD